MSNGVLLRIRRAVREKRYRFTDHALEEGDADGLSEDDVLTVLLTGALDSIYTDDLAVYVMWCVATYAK